MWWGNSWEKEMLNNFNMSQSHWWSEKCKLKQILLFICLISRTGRQPWPKSTGPSRQEAPAVNLQLLCLPFLQVVYPKEMVAHVHKPTSCPAINAGNKAHDHQQGRWHCHPPPGKYHGGSKTITVGPHTLIWKHLQDTISQNGMLNKEHTIK